ncbi:pyrroline-5-carboxylate reductase [Kurthia sibirica]|uniref:Pyrroline-5-carboxylate reductase n=1 Tax=Kurthia sibirica TaxID=202750 RepID=A0A2U3ALH9_9BACL|nr:pyrroline-5-carboxylate reductase [Kurthia sibirica]PWI25360.1 pyrroline-5-carboxylate reductase [Kurthia sibirica]GEK34625.1 pyrroline-5-carboxylate reductase [Kurthia sibirica]
MQTIVFAGAGSMAEAMIQGWVKEGIVAPQSIYVMNKTNKKKLDELAQQFGVQVVVNSRDILTRADCVILAMKPKDIAKAMVDIAPLLGQQTIVLSVVAGVSIDSIQSVLGKRPVARVMPNTSATIGMSASGIAFSDEMTNDMKVTFKTLLEAIGIVFEVKEEELHAITALSGSGPAYLYYLVEAFEAAAVKHGLEQSTVRALAIQTIAGAAEMLKQSDAEPQELRRRVTSPGGTTAAGINALENHHFKETIAACIDEATKRSRELANDQC